MPGVQTCEIVDIELFRDLAESELAWICERLYGRVYAAGSEIITVQQPGEVVYLIQSGTVKIHIGQADGTDVILSILGPGDIVGEMSLIDSVGRSASVVTLEESRLLWMSGAVFQECLRDIPQVAQNLVRVLTARVRLADELIQALASLDVHGRVARQILAFAERYGEIKPTGQVSIPIRLTQGDIADLVGASRKRVNQVMVAFKNQAYITVDDRGRITVNDRKALARFCQ